jgi:uncharacterized protein (DUF1800 family)
MPFALQNPTPSTAEIDPAWAWKPYEPTADRPWTRRLAGHLLRRAGFGASWEELQRSLREGPRRSVDRLLKPPGDVDAFQRTHDDYEAGAADSADALRAWWLRRMIDSPQPLLEKLTLFWHDHFAVSASRVQDARSMSAHVGLLRKHALGRFPDLLKAVVADPAVLTAFHAQANRKAEPSEHFARQLLARFTVGPGQFSDRDVRDTARAFTGWFILRGELRYFEREYDGEAKTVLGRTGNFDRAAVLPVLLEQPATARHLVRRLYRWFISETDEPEDALLKTLTGVFAADYDVRRLVETMLRSNLFFSAAAYRQKVKRPVEFALGIVRGLEGNVATLRLANDLAWLGERLYDPPTGEGWAGGKHWINPATIMGRSNLALDLVRGSGPYGDKLNPAQVARQYGHNDIRSAAQFFTELFLQGDVPAEVVDTAVEGLSADGNLSTRLRTLTQRVVTLPEFQLA